MMEFVLNNIICIFLLQIWYKTHAEIIIFFIEKKMEGEERLMKKKLKSKKIYYLI